MAGCDVFISYARVDDAPGVDGSPGWVSGIRDVIVADSRAVEGREYRVFFDRSEITKVQDWRARILGALRTSRVLLVCLSPAYFASAPCRWEWEEFVQRQARLMASAGAGEADDGTVASVFFVSLPDAVPAEVSAWREQVLRGDGLDLREWFPHGPQLLA